jgi:hypothetical protein
MRLIVLLFCLTLVPAQTLAQDDTDHALRMYNEASAQYVTIRDWTRQTVSTAKEHANAGDMNSACAYFKGARDGTAQQMAALTDMVRFAEAANRSSSTDRQNLEEVLRTNQTLSEYVDENCGEGSDGDPHTTYMESITGKIERSIKAYETFGRYLEEGYALGNTHLCTTMRSAIDYMTDARDTLREYRSWTRSAGEPFPEDAKEIENDIPGYLDTMYSQYTQACPSSDYDSYDDYDD